MRGRKLIVSVVMVTVLAMFAGAALAADKVLKVGVLGPFTGPSAKNGAEFKASVEMALEKIN
ncbi:MAG: branched-chain amino acid ABC transporter substrate-binding protein, partial [Desulfobacterales bacterium]